MANQDKISKAHALVEANIQSHVETLASSITSGNTKPGRSSRHLVVPPPSPSTSKRKDPRSDLEKHVLSFIVPKERKRSAYVCTGCQAIYWVNNVNCDCNLPREKQYTMAKVTVVSPVKPFNEMKPKGKPKCRQNSAK